MTRGERDSGYRLASALVPQLDQTAPERVRNEAEGNADDAGGLSGLNPYLLSSVRRPAERGGRNGQPGGVGRCETVRMERADEPDQFAGKGTITLDGSGLPGPHLVRWGQLGDVRVVDVVDLRISWQNHAPYGCADTSNAHHELAYYNTM